MLRQVSIYKDGEIIYQQNFGKSLDDTAFQGVMKNIEKEVSKSSDDKVRYYDYYRYRISYIAEKSKNIIFLFVSDLSDKFDSVDTGLKKTKKEFLLMFESVLDHRFDKQTFDIFDPTIESIHKALRPKISLVGFSGVGKTTLTNLIQEKEIPTEHIPTITGDIATIKIGNLHFHLWDFAGQEQFSFLWNNFIKGSDAVLLITDSTLENCEKSKYFIDLIHKEVPNAHQAVLGNKQDLPDAMPVADIERILNLKTYSMVATDPNNRNKMITIIADVLEMSSEISPLLKPLIDRDKKIKQAEDALEAGDVRTAVNLFDEVADLCLKLGDDVYSQDFHDKANKFKKILKSVEAQYAKPAIQEQETPTIQKPETEAISNQGEETPTVQVSDSQVNNDENKHEQEITQQPQQPQPQQPQPQQPQPQQPQPQQPQPQQPQPQQPQPQQPKITGPAAGNSVNNNLKSDSILASMKSGRGVVQSEETRVGTPTNPTSTGLSNLDKLKQMLDGVGSPTETNSSSQQNNITKPLINQNATGSEKPILDTASTNGSGSSFQSNLSTDPQQKAKINRDIMDLRIKLTNVSKTLTDLEMDNIMGTLSDEDYERKVSRLKVVEQNINSQIEELRKFLD